MQIDRTIESHVRDAFSAVVGQDEADLKTTLRQLSEPDIRTSLVYAIFAVGYIVSDVFQGAPDEAGLTEMARDAIEGTAEWVDLGSVAAVAAFLKSATAGDANFPGVPQDDIAGYAFIVGGYLLSRYRPDGKRWFEYLDDIWNAAVATDSEQSGPSSPTK